MGYTCYISKSLVMREVGSKMFTRSMMVPKVTTETLEAINALAPGLPSAFQLKTVTTMEAARKIAETAVEAKLVRYECISTRTSPIITETAAGWHFQFTIVGD